LPGLERREHGREAAPVGHQVAERPHHVGGRTIAAYHGHPDRPLVGVVEERSGEAPPDRLGYRRWLLPVGYVGDRQGDLAGSGDDLARPAVPVETQPGTQGREPRHEEPQFGGDVRDGGTRR
jgi:hypothetical protein